MVTGGYAWLVSEIIFNLELALHFNKEKPSNQRLVSALDRNGLWYITQDFDDILLIAEKTFCFEVQNRNIAVGAFSKWVGEALGGAHFKISRGPQAFLVNR